MVNVLKKNLSSSSWDFYKSANILKITKRIRTGLRLVIIMRVFFVANYSKRFVFHDLFGTEGHVSHIEACVV